MHYPSPTCNDGLDREIFTVNLRLELLVGQAEERHVGWDGPNVDRPGKFSENVLTEINLFSK